MNQDTNSLKDPIDFATGMTAEVTNRRVEEIRKEAAMIPVGEPGECERCGEHSLRLVRGACARCRDKLNLP